jgi:hypothetical protein
VRPSLALPPRLPMLEPARELLAATLGRVRAEGAHQVPRAASSAAGSRLCSRRCRSATRWSRARHAEGVRQPTSCARSPPSSHGMTSVRLRMRVRVGRVSICIT